MSSIPHPAVLITGIGATFNLFRLAGDLVSTASAREIDKDTTYSSNNSSSGSGSGGGSGGGSSKSNGTSGVGYGTTGKGGSGVVSVVGNGKGGSNMNPSSEVQPLLPSKKDDDEETGGGFGSTGSLQGNNGSLARRRLPRMSLLVHCILLCYFLTACILNALRSHHQPTEDETGDDHNSIDPFGDALFDAVPLGWCCGAIFVGILMNVRDPKRERFGRGQRILYSLCAVLLLIGSVTRVYSSSSSTKATIVDYGTMVATLLFTILSRIESTLCPHPDQHSKEGKEEGSGKKKKKTLSYGSLLILLKPYFWPDATSSSAMLNRTRAILTWVCVISSKICGLIGPILIGKAASYLAIYEYWDCAIMVLYYALVQFLKNVFSEGQRLVYLKVGQAAFVQLSEVTFEHLHSLSLDWHLNKKLGDVIRSMDRGISACDELMNWLFLRLLPALVECIVVCIIFATYFNYFPLAVWVFFFVFLYIITTIVLTLWRRQFRQAVVKSDNDWHDICTDSLLNFETVKFFTAEKYELKRFGEAVEKYQSGSVSMQASSSLLNNVQLLILQMCLATSLSLTALAIKERMDCCIDLGCTDDIDFACCADIGNKDGICPGMDVGDFVAVLTYTLKLFEPLNFLGFVYNRLIMAIIDLTNLSEILAQQPDVIDAKNALLMPSVNVYDPSIVVEFDNVTFHYPSQDERYNGFKGLSFKLKRGTVTAVVGPTGSGKTTISRLLFRFYDVLDGAVKVNGIDIRSLTQESLHSNIGFVPQQTNMFNDTLKFNIKYGKRDATQEELDQVAQDAQLDTFIDSLEDGWETKVGDRGLKLSGGEQQRVAIARCLLKDPPIVVLDEATSALDTLTESSVQDALDRLGSDRTCLVIAHRLGTVRNADNILVLKDGMVNEQGTHDELLALNGTYADMWNMQLHTPKGSSADLMSK